jgi:serine/threonine-protein kinase HipA
MSAAPNNGFAIVERLHQEDCCQACGVMPDFKYEHDGGPGFKQIRDLLTMYSKSPVEDISMLVKWALFNYLVGNCDAHAKNLSLLHNGDGTISLAPTYDIISTAVYNSRFGTKLSRGMGMRIGMHENIDKVNAQDLILFAQEIRMRPQQIKSMGEEIIRKLSPAFSTACLVAQREGFKEAGDMADRIMNGCNQRATILLS